MSDDFPVKGRSNRELREIAKSSRQRFGVELEYVDIIRCLTSGHVDTVKGPKRLVLQIRPDSDMPRDDALTEYSGKVVTVSVRESVFAAANSNDGRARQTLAHELGHAVLHEGAPKARRHAAAGKTGPHWIRAYESAEHQAKLFAASFLMDRAVATSSADAKELARRCGVSLESARIAFEEWVLKPQEKAASHARVDALVADFKNSKDKPHGTTDQPVPSPAKVYLNEPCPICGELKLEPIGSKTRCANCKEAGDMFQDGDAVR